jgi:ribosomal protein S18 acetylase RimI-like enzyme
MRVATAADAGLVTGIVASAFAHDPVWGPALRRPDASVAHHTAFWRHFVDGAIPNGMVFLADQDAAIALWIPPGEEEMTDATVEHLRAVVAETLPPTSHDRMFALWERFDENHPQAEPHAYLSLLATDPAHRGNGVAQDLVRENLS